MRSPSDPEKPNRYRHSEASAKNLAKLYDDQGYIDINKYDDETQFELITLALLAYKAVEPPYPWCHGSPTREDCAARGYCNRDPNCGE